MHQRYIRQLQLKGFGEAAQQQLAQARVLVVGAGGLGVPVLQYLTGMGVGTLGVADGDVVSLSNLPRQVLYTEQEVGKLKVAVALQKLAQQNPDVALVAHPTFLTVQNALEIIAAYDLVIDATDTFEARYLINDACVVLGKPFVYGALHQFEGQVSVFNHAGGPTYRCLYPTPPAAHEIPDCNTAGVLGVVPGLVGCHQALEAVKVLTGVGEPLSGYLLMLDFLHQTQYKVKLKAKPENLAIKQLQSSYTLSSCAAVPELSPQELALWMTQERPFLLLDVREPHEFAQGHLPTAQSVPLSSFQEFDLPVPPHLPLVTICQKGSRSQSAALQLLSRFPDRNVFSVTGGMDLWQQQQQQKKPQLL